MFSMGGDDAAAGTPSFIYPDIRPYTLREMLMQEREASGMFFSGQLLDGYAKCVEALEPMAIAQIIPAESEDEEAETETALLPDRAKVKVAGIITGVTLKTTKREERMAFFTLEDAGGVIECLAFPKVFQKDSDIIRTDNAVFVEGNLSVREDEAPKILVSLMGLLVDNEHFSGSEIQKVASNPAAEKNPPPAGGQKPESWAQAASAPSADAPRPRAPGGGYNPYEAMTPTRAYNPYETMPAAASPPRPAATGPAPRPTPAEPAAPARPPQPAHRAQPAQTPSPHKLFLRVPNMEGEAYQKALNLCEIFCDGATAVIFYDVSTGKYFSTNMKVRATPFVLERFTRVLGEGNVVGK